MGHLFSGLCTDAAHRTASCLIKTAALREMQDLCNLMTHNRTSKYTGCMPQRTYKRLHALVTDKLKGREPEKPWRSHYVMDNDGPMLANLLPPDLQKPAQSLCEGCGKLGTLPSGSTRSEGTLQRCGRCRSVAYCSKSCQQVRRCMFRAL